MKKLAALLILVALMTLAAGNALAGGCYRPFVSYAAPAYHAPHSTYYPSYYHREYVPYVVEVQVQKDRYYSLSDLYRDRLYIEAFDLMKDMRQKMAQQQEPASAPAPAAGPGYGKPDQVPRPAQLPTEPQARKAWGKTTDAAAKVLATGCVKCHGEGSEKLDLSNLNAVSPTKRWAAFGMAASGDMPPPPAELRAKGKEAELEKWKQEHALKEEDLKALYDGWVVPGQIAKKQ